MSHSLLSDVLPLFLVRLCTCFLDTVLLLSQDNVIYITDHTRTHFKSASTTAEGTNICNLT